MTGARFASPFCGGSALPAADSLRALAERLGISGASRAVAYGHEAPMAARFLLSLGALGVSRLSYLNGGLPKRLAEGRPVVAGEPAVPRGAIAPAPWPALTVDATGIGARLGRPGLSPIDTRTSAEYAGTGTHRGMPSTGHLDGARPLEWEWMFEAANPLLLKPERVLRALFAERVRPGDAVVTYCWVGYRASATWFVARALGLDARLLRRIVRRGWPRRRSRRAPPATSRFAGCWRSP